MIEMMMNMIARIIVMMIMISIIMEPVMTIIITLVMIANKRNRNKKRKEHLRSVGVLFPTLVINYASHLNKLSVFTCEFKTVSE